MKQPLLAFTAVAEAATGLGLALVPSLVSRLLLGTEVSGVAEPIARVAGIALIGLGVSCWPRWSPLCGMLAYSAVVTVYLGWVASLGKWGGPLLWPAVVIHAMLTLLLGRAWFRARAPIHPTETASGAGISRP